MSPSVSTSERLAGAVWGHLVGDAVGVPYEFGPARKPKTVVFGTKGAHGQPPGTWSDDGALMLALLNSLQSGHFDVEDQGRRAVDWFRRGAYAPGRKVFDYGGTTAKALGAIDDGTPAASAGPSGEYDCGNGSLMRILPIALVDRDTSDKELVDRAQRASRVTHGHARAQVACALLVLIARRLLKGSGGRSASLIDARQTLRTIYEGDLDRLAALDHLESYPDRGGRGRVWDSFWSAWDAFAGAKDYRVTIQRAVAYGEDTDTTAAIAGGLAGIRWGIGGIPWEWLRGMRGREIVEPIVSRLAKPEDPIRVDWVDLAKVPGLAKSKGRLGMTLLPGKDEGPGGRHHRNLVKDVHWLRLGFAVDAFLLLVEDHELRRLRVADLPDVMAKTGIELIRHPIPDGGTPADPTTLIGTLDDVRTRLDAGQNLVVACRGGLGRTGTVVACLLRDSGLDSMAAMELTRASRDKTIENNHQERFVESWARTVATLGSPLPEGHALYSERFIEAAAVAMRLHANQTRKSTSIPYVSHLFGTCSIALEYGANEDQAIAALLHDAIEDIQPTDEVRAIVAGFGPEVLRIVEACTDADIHPKPPWRERKEAYVGHLATEDAAALLVSASDKLHNARAIVSDLHRVGPAVWDRFNADSDQLWYYRALVSAFRSNPAHEPALIDELDRTVTEMERLGGGAKR